MRGPRSLVDRADAPDESGAGEDGLRRITRRAALSLGGAVAGAVRPGMPCPPWPPTSRAGRRRIARRRPRISSPTRRRVLAFRCHGFHLEILDRPITPLGSHYLLIHFDIPTLQAEDYAITVGGRVNKELTLTLEDLKRAAGGQAADDHGVRRQRPVLRASAVDLRAVVQRGDRASTSTPGTPLRPILEEAGLLDDADGGRLHRPRRRHRPRRPAPFERALPVDEALKDGVMLAWEANGQPLLPAHGFPLRLIVPTWYGMASVKWLKKITVIDHTFQGVEQKLVYRLQTSSSDGGPPDAGEVRARGDEAARASRTPISRMRFVDAGPGGAASAWRGRATARSRRVEVSTDDRRTWRAATLGEPVSPFAWTPWRFTWDASDEGRDILSCRATDAAGNRQPLKPFWNVQGMAQNGVERIGVRVI